MILVGISTKDSEDDVAKLAQKIVNLRLFEDTSNTTTIGKYYGKPWSKSVSDDPDWSILSVSQFTLYGNIKKGTKPDFHAAAKGEAARNLYYLLLTQLRDRLGEHRVKDGKFGEMMDVSLVNDGPVTIIWDTQNKDI